MDSLVTRETAWVGGRREEEGGRERGEEGRKKGRSERWKETGTDMSLWRRADVLFGGLAVRIPGAG